MPLSEREQKVLDELEREFGTSRSGTAPARARANATGRLVAAAIALPVGLLCVVLGLWRNDAAGVALSVVAYLILVSAATVIADCVLTRVAGRRPHVLIATRR